MLIMLIMRFFIIVNINRHWLYGEISADEEQKTKRKNCKGWFPRKCVILSDKLDENSPSTTTSTSDKKTDQIKF